MDTVNFMLNDLVNAWSYDRNVKPCNNDVQIISLYHSKYTYLRERESIFLFPILFQNQNVPKQSDARKTFLEFQQEK